MGILGIGIAALASTIVVGNACINKQRDDFNKRLNDSWYKQYRQQEQYYEYCKKLKELSENL